MGLGISLGVFAWLLESMPRRLLCLPQGGSRCFGRRGALQQATLLHDGREAQEQRLIGTEQYANQHEAERGRTWRITMGTGGLHGYSPPSKVWEPRERYQLTPQCASVQTPNMDRCRRPIWIGADAQYG